MKSIIKYAAILLLLCLSTHVARAQQELSLPDVLAPYYFTAVVLKNGHFFISTKYLDFDDPKPLIYKEDDGGLTPPNYTSHVHFKVDDLIFQLPFEDNPVTELPPPEHELTVLELFRDTLQKRPRINARLQAVMPDGERLQFVFTMEPVLRPSGGFIRISTSIDTSDKAHDIGVLLLIDTKIGDNDRAPIVTSYGYYDTEREFTKPVSPGIPDFWLALEGSPVNPGLTARGNLKAPGLIEPDLFMFGNWANYTGTATIRGLGKFLWKDRDAQDTLPYTDSAVLLIWDEERVNARQKRILSSTEIGIVDSLQVVDAGSTYPGGGGGSGLGAGLFYARSEGCLSFEKIIQTDCNDTDYHTYSPDSLQFLFVITNTVDKTFDNVRIELGNLPEGIRTDKAQNTVLPSTLAPDVSAVGVFSIYADPRLYDARINIPVLLMGNANDTLALDEVCVDVPGVIARDSVVELDFELLCPSMKDTMETLVFLKGIRCRNLKDVYVIGNPPDINCFRILDPLPGEIRAQSFVPVSVEFQPSALGSFQAQIVAEVWDEDGFAGGDTVVVRDTADVFGTGKDEEFFLASRQDTLDLGPVCIGDSTLQEWPILNLGGCDVVIKDYFLLGNDQGQFQLANAGEFPFSIPKEDTGSIGRAEIKFVPWIEGPDTVRLVIVSDSRPRSDTLVVTARGDLPHLVIPDTLVQDTICPGRNVGYRIWVSNETACIVDVDTCFFRGSGQMSAQPSEFSLPALAQVPLSVSASSNTIGQIIDTLLIFTKEGLEYKVPFEITVADRKLSYSSNINFGDLRVGTEDTLSIEIESIGDAAAVITGIRVGGVHSSDYYLSIPPGVQFPLWMVPGEILTIEAVFAPTDIEGRSANIIIDTDPDRICTLTEDIFLKGRGYRPLISLAENSVYLGRICIGEKADSSFSVSNLGNGALLIENFTINGSNDFDILQNLPLTIDPGSSAEIAFDFIPEDIGDFDTRIYFESDGDWLSIPDTLHLSGTGIICAELSLDTVSGLVGSKVEIPVHLRPKEGTLTDNDEIIELLTGSQHNSIRFSIAHKKRLFRFDSAPLADGMIAGSENISVYPDSAVIEYSGGSLNSSPYLALPVGEILLGDSFESRLILTVSDFASGYSEIETTDGLLLPAYCGFDRRLIDASDASLLLALSENPVQEEAEISIYSSVKRSVTMNLYDMLGRKALSIYSGTIEEGQRKFILNSSGLPSGAYRLILTDGEKIAGKNLIVL